MNIRVDLKKQIDDSYDIVFNSNPGKVISDFVSNKKILIVTDENVHDIHFSKFVSSIDRTTSIHHIVIGVGEDHKNFSSVSDVCAMLDSLEFNRNDYIVVLGGGVVGDIAGFASSIYKRGISFIQVPTTLLSMFDSSVGGKTGVNFANQKNLIGNFYQPQLVVINPKYLETLESIELLSGFFEGVKHALIDSVEHFEFLQSHYHHLFQKNIDADKISHIIQISIQVKTDLVHQDEHEQHERKFLNFGHTLGHAIESVSRFEIPHGICVAYGMIYETLLSLELGYLSQDQSDLIITFISRILSSQKHVFQYQLIQELSFEKIYQKMCNDKKNTDEDIVFILLKGIGFPDIHKESNQQLCGSIFTQMRICVK